MKDLYRIEISVRPSFLPEQSKPDAAQFAFAYHVKIKNTGLCGAELQSRHWVITDSDGHVQEVRGPGVVGQTPNLEPGEEFEYTSGAIIKTPVGLMQGSYQMRAADGHQFDAPIAPFTLSVPRTLH
jgi:ApaG protein